MLNLKNKRIFVSGAGSGMGRAVALLASQAEACVFATDINSSLLSSMKQNNIYTDHLDVTDRNAVENYFSDKIAFDGIVNMAGWVHHGTIIETSKLDWVKSFNINVDSMFNVISSALPKMIDAGNGGSIVNMASLASSIKGFQSRAAYGSSKGAVVGLTKSIAVDYLSSGIRCNAICPGTIDTPSLKNRIKNLAIELGSIEKARSWFVSRQPMKRLGLPNEIGKLIIYLLSDDGAYATGQSYIIDGGTTS
jgi:2-keto-3-deoxy-L-fuconate dehydrogenase